jgi:hypothetical protein
MLPLSHNQLFNSLPHSQAVRNRTTLKQADCKNAFCHPELPKDEPTIVRPPAGCPISKPNTYWRLKKTPLYGLRRSPRHWYHLITKQLKAINLRQTAHEDCLFVGKIIPGRPPLYLATYVDDIIYFSADPSVEKQFEADFSAHVKVGAILGSWVNLMLYGNKIREFEAANNIVCGAANSIASAKAFGEYFE